MPIKTKSGKWKWGNVERSSKKELVQTVYGIWKKNGSKGSFSDFLKGTHESLDESFNLDKTNLYFHGSFDRDIEKIDKPSIEHPFCVTQDIQYALDYADGGDESDDSTNGVVYLVTIDEDSLKIFDFEDDSDIKKLNSKWPTKILDCFSKKHRANKGKLIDPLIVCDLLINNMDYSEDDSKITKLMNTSILKRLEKFVGKKWKSIFEFRDDPSIKSGEYILRNLLLTDIKDLGFNGYKAHEQSGHSSDKCFILFDLDCMDKIFLQPISFKDAVAAAEYMDKKFSKSDADIDYKKHDAAIKEFIRSLKKTKQSVKESMIAEDTKTYAYHCTDVDPEIIKKEGWKVGDGFTLDNQFKDLYKKYLPKVPVFVSRLDVPVWDSKSKYCIKLDITGLELFPDFGYLPDFGAYYDYGEECFYWENEEDLDSNKKLKDFVLNNCDNLTLYADCFDGNDSFNVLGTACVDGSKLKDRIIEWKSSIKESYEPPYTLDAIKQKYGDEVYRKLKDDPVHRFRAETGIEVIHKEPTRDEFERIVKNWDLMTPEQKKQSDEFSMKQFGKNNHDRIDTIRKSYMKKESLNEAHEIHLHKYPENLQPILERIVKGNEDYKLDHAYFNKEGKFIWMRNLKGYFHVFKPVKFVKTPGMMKPFGLKDLILKDNGMLEEVNRYRFENGQEAMKFLQQRYKFDKNSIS